MLRRLSSGGPSSGGRVGGEENNPNKQRDVLPWRHQIPYSNGYDVPYRRQGSVSVSVRRGQDPGRSSFC